MANDTSNYPDFVFIAYYEDAHEETHDFAVSMEAGSLVGTPLKYVRHDLNTRPAAPVEGLETARREYRWGGDKNWKAYGPIFTVPDMEVRELVTRPQAEAIITAERKMRKTAEQRLAQSQDDLKQARSDNASLTGRVKELGGDRDSWRRVAEKLAGEKQALETQLAAANEALDRIKNMSREDGPWDLIAHDMQQIAASAREVKP